MPTITQSKVVPYNVQQMFHLVNDIEKYPQFLPWCPKTRIHRQENNTVEATVHFAKGPLNHAFTTVNQLTPYQRVDMQLLHGPFRTLEGSWSFEACEEGSKIAFHLTFEWHHRWMALALGPFFNHIASSLIEAFSARAKMIYV